MRRNESWQSRGMESDHSRVSSSRQAIEYIRTLENKYRPSVVNMSTCQRKSMSCLFIDIQYCIIFFFRSTLFQKKTMREALRHTSTTYAKKRERFGRKLIHYD